MISKILEHAGHIPIIVGNGQEALDKLESCDDNSFDIVIMDMQMPIMGGIEATKIYRFTRIGKDTLPIVILTANATTEAFKECEEAGVDAYLTKPIEAKKLLSTIYSLTENFATDSPRERINYKNLAPNKTIKKYLDPSVINELSALSCNNEFIHTLISGFMNDAKSLLKEMEKSLTEKNFENYLECAHALKGSSGSIGALKVHELCREVLTHESSESYYLNSLKEMYKTYDKTEDSLREYLSETAIDNRIIINSP